MGRVGLDVECLVRGHDHVDANQGRWERLEEYGNRVLTINSISYNQEPITGVPSDPRWPTVACWRPGRRLVPLEVRYSQALWDHYAKLRSERET